jgi:hypothetical protein
MNRRKTNPLPGVGVHAGVIRGLVYAGKQRIPSYSATAIRVRRLESGWRWRYSGRSWTRTTWTLRASGFQGSRLPLLWRCCLLFPDLLRCGRYAPKKHVIKKQPQRIGPAETEKQDQRKGNKHASVPVEFHKQVLQYAVVSIRHRLLNSHSHISRSESIRQEQGGTAWCPSLISNPPGGEDHHLSRNSFMKRTVA